MNLNNLIMIYGFMINLKKKTIFLFIQQLIYLIIKFMKYISFYT